MIHSTSESFANSCSYIRFHANIGKLCSVAERIIKVYKETFGASAYQILVLRDGTIMTFEQLIFYESTYIVIGHQCLIDENISQTNTHVAARVVSFIPLEWALAKMICAFKGIKSARIDSAAIATANTASSSHLSEVSAA